MGVRWIHYLLNQLKKDLKLIKDSTLLIFDEAEIMSYNKYPLCLQASSKQEPQEP